MTDAAVIIRRLQPEDSIAAMTRLLHRAYRPLAERGLRYMATHQSEAVTRQRVATGECHVAVTADGELVGTITFVPASRPAPGDGYYERPDVAWFQQFAIDPESQGRGIGARLMDLVERRAAETGAAFIALDTAEHAEELIATYLRRGYAIVAGCDWSETNYRSVFMSRALGGDSGTPARPQQP